MNKISYYIIVTFLCVCFHSKIIGQISSSMQLNSSIQNELKSFPINIYESKIDLKTTKKPDNRGLYFALNMGMLKGNSYNANYYNGNPDLNENNINYILKNNYYYNEIKNSFNGKDFKLYSIPENMTYDASIMAGFHIKYKIANNMGFFIQFNFSKLNTNGLFSLEIDSVTFTSEPALRYFGIYGQEERTYIDIGLHREYFLGEKSNFYIEGGINFTNTLVKKNGIMINDLDYSIINVYGNQQYVPNTGLQPYEIRQGGIGFGFFIGSGVSLIFNEKVSVEPGFNIFYQSINLTGYENYHLNYSAFVRLMLRDFL